MPHDIQDVLARLAAATTEVLHLETVRYADPRERHVVSELFVRLRPRFPEWNVSNEYDRREQETKRLLYRNPRSGALLEADITPDLVVHRVGHRDNLLVVEVSFCSSTATTCGLPNGWASRTARFETCDCRCVDSTTKPRRCGP